MAAKAHPSGQRAHERRWRTRMSPADHLSGTSHPASTHNRAWSHPASHVMRPKQPAARSQLARSSDAHRPGPKDGSPVIHPDGPKEPAHAGPSRGVPNTRRRRQQAGPAGPTHELASQAALTTQLSRPDLPTQSEGHRQAGRPFAPRTPRRHSARAPVATGPYRPKSRTLTGETG